MARRPLVMHRARALRFLAACTAVGAWPSAVAHAAEQDEVPAATTPAGANGATVSVPVNDKAIVVWPTLTPAGDDVAGTAVHKPGPGEGAVYARAMELDATLRDAVEDLGYTLDVADPGPAMGHARDLDMVGRAQH